MKKSLFLLPLLAGLALCGCGDDKGGGQGGGGGGGGKGGGDFPGLTINEETLSEVEDTEQKGYSRLAGVDEMDGVPVSFTSVMTNGLNSESIPVWNTPNDEKVQVIQFKKSEGEITVTGKITTLTLNVYSSYEWSSTGLPKVTFDGTTIKKPSKAEKIAETGCQNVDKGGTAHDLNLMTVVYNVDATEEGELSISNTNSFALYFESFIIE